MSKKRVRTLTTKAMDLYTGKVKSFEGQLCKSWEAVQEVIGTKLPESSEETRIILRELEHRFEEFQAVHLCFCDFLVQTRTEHSKTKLEEITQFEQSKRNDYRLFMDKLQRIASGEKRTNYSRSNKTLNTSLSESLVLARAKAEAVKAKLKVTEEQVKLKEEMANLEGKLTLLNEKKELAAAEAELEVLENENESRAPSLVDEDIVKKRTAQFIMNLPKADDAVRPKEPKGEAVTSNINAFHRDNEPPQLSQGVRLTSNRRQVLMSDNRQEYSQNQHASQETLTNFLLRKELVMSRLVRFNDRPDSFIAWKASFQHAAKELNVTPLEEMDLLVKYLGPESHKSAASLRTVYLTKPDEGLHHLWSRLDERYGSPEQLYKTVLTKLEFFPKLTVKDQVKLYELADILSEIVVLQADEKYKTVLSYFNSSVGISPIVSKLPYGLQEKWATKSYTYKRAHNIPFPPLSLLQEFVLDQARIRNDPSTQLTNRAQLQPSASRERSGARNSVTVNKNTFEEHHGNELSNEKKLNRCPIHKSKHSLSDCRTFQQKPHEEKWKLLKNLKLCFKCLRSTKHQGRSCPEGISCQKCGKDHPTVMHMDQGGENAERREPDFKDSVTIESKCTELCGEEVKGKSCAKIVLIRVYRKDNPEDFQSCYAIIDEQSNHTLVKPELFTLLGLGGEQIEYSLASCSGLSVRTGRKADGLVIESFDGTVAFDLPTVIECLDIPCNRDEIPSPSVAACHPHLSDVAQYIPEIDEHIEILMLIGRDITDVHHVLDQRTGPLGSPFAQQLPLGWVIVGEVCLGDKHVTSNVSVNKTFVVGDGRASLLPPCTSKFHVTESIDHDVNNIVHNCNNTYVIDNGRHTVFKSCSNLQNLDHVFTYDYVFGVDVRDNEPSLSFEDRDFLSLMDDKFVLNSENRWSAPLPFKACRPRLPCNKGYALQRAKSLQVSLNKDPAKKQHFVEFMGKLLTNGHAERAPELHDDAECWYLPIFGVYHPKKPNKIRVVFDSAAQFEGVSLNSVLLQGPDLTNSLLGVLLRFRREKVAISVDVEQMFYCFGVCEKDRDYLRFFWHEENDTSKPPVQYRMCKHVFGNSPSPAIATYGLRKAVESADSDVKQFVQRDFYVDDGLTSVPSVAVAQDLIKRTKASLAVTGLHIHKITSNAPEVLKGFSKEDLATDLNCLDFDHESLPTQRSLGLGWDLNQDRFVFSNECYDKPVTKRGILATINSVFDPLGFLAPVLIEGRLLMREVVSSGVEWDEPLHQDLEAKWNLWLNSLKDLSFVEINRSLFEVSLSTLMNLELHIFSDASEKAIAAVVYIVGCSSDGTRYVSFVMGKAKVAPSKGHTIPRLELCAAVLATELYMLVSENLGVNFAQTSFYTDSKVVLGYIGNQSRRFYTYVSNRTQKIRRVSSPQQWKYIQSEYNPADLGSRGLSPLQLKNSVWLLGPAFLSECTRQVPEFYPMVNPDFDNEVRQNVVTRTTNVQSRQSLGTDRFERFSSWTKLLLSIGVLLHVVMSFRKVTSCAGWHICSKSSSTECRNLAKVLVLREVQYGSFKAEIHALIAQSPIQANSPLSLLDPFIDDDGLIRVGGRLRQSSLPIQEKHPVILPYKSHVTKLVVRHYHESVLHQGRSFTEGALRQDGYWIIGSKRAVSSCIFNCVPCKKLRGRFEHQKMADLPVDRIDQETPFSHVGVDVFGPWQVVSRRTRSSQASSKRWAVLFTCLVVRAIHIEVVDEMSTSAFINALRRFIAIRGKVKIFRSDRGTNFVGATDLIGVNAFNVEDEQTKNFLRNNGSVWIFNPPHSSHMGGAWERMIGVSRRILESMLSKTPNLSHDVLVTLMAEVSAIVNARPIVPVSTDPDCPEVLSPSALLTLKLDHDLQPVDDMSIKDLYKDQWRHVQYLAGQFWLRWRKEFLQSLQTRRKWQAEQTPLQQGDVVLLKDRGVCRNDWPMGRVSKVFPSSDDRIRKVEVVVFKEGKLTSYTRPVVELVLLVKCLK